MDILYIPQLDETDAGDGTAGRYRILRRTPEGGTVALSDRAVTRIELNTASALRLVVPPLVKGAVRDFFVRIVITADEVPEITFAAPEGETISFEDIDDTVLSCETGINVFSFTENDEGVFFVNRKTTYISHSVELDACGGEGVASTATFMLGAKFTGLPTPVRDGYAFQGWFTETEGGVRVTEESTVKTGITKLYARWESYVDPFGPVICTSGNLAFSTSGDLGWSIDYANYHAEPGAARSGPIADGQSSVLQTTLAGAGMLSFWWKASSEAYDNLVLLVDGEEVSNISGTDGDWRQFTLEVTTGGQHTVQWRYVKDVSVSEGDDCGWIDEVSWMAAKEEV